MLARPIYFLPMREISFWLVCAAGCYLVALAVLSLVRPARVAQFLEAHASTPTAHYAELALRLAVGAAFVGAAPVMAGTVVFDAFGRVIIGTTLVLLVVPWRVHQRFAQWSVPQATQRMWLLGLAAGVGGAVVLASLFGPRIAA